MIEYIISIGLNDRETYQQEIETEAARQMVYDAFGECTIQDCRGSFRHENGIMTYECSFRVYIYAGEKDEPRIINACRELKNALNQEAIYISKREVNSQMI